MLCSLEISSRVAFSPCGTFFISGMEKSSCLEAKEERSEIDSEAEANLVGEAVDMGEDSWVNFKILLLADLQTLEPGLARYSVSVIKWQPSHSLFHSSGS